MAYRYYLTQRPPVPGSVPSGVRAVSDFGVKQYVQRIGEAYGYVEYDEPLTEKQISDYELTEQTLPYDIEFDDGRTGRVYTTERVAAALYEAVITGVTEAR